MADYKDTTKGNNSNILRRPSVNSYSNYVSRQQDRTWKQQLDQEYAYRRALESKFGKDALVNNKKAIEEMQKYQASLQAKYAKDSIKQERELRKKALELAKEAGTLTKQERKEYQSLRRQESLEDLPEKIAQEVSNSLSNAFSSLLDNIGRKIDGYIDVTNSYAASVNTRLQGTDKSYSQITNLISGKLFGSPYVKQTEVLEKLNELVSAGISYNVEQRAFLSAMTDKIVTTFDAANSTLLRIIRLQQADSTVARMGMESLLNKYLNATYQDTSYLTDLYDTIESTLVESISQLSTTVGAEFEAVAQKWLGSLYSVGASSSTLTSIAEGINYLASGNVQSLSSNTALQNLLIMGANRAGLNYGSLLTGGMSTSDLNRLFAGIVSYAQDIADTDNLVVKNQYASIFGLSMSDLTALLQMGDDLSYVIEQTLTYSDAISEVQSQLSSVGSRTPLAEQISNVFDNIMFSAAQGIANNAGAYATWLVTNLVEEATGGINIPFISVMGSGVDLNATVTQLMKVGIVGASLLGQIGNIVSGLSSGGALSLEGWGATDYTTRGTGFTGIVAGAQTTTSQSMAVGNSGGDDIASGAITQAKAEAMQTVAGQETDDQKLIQEIEENVSLIADILQAVFDGSSALRVKVMDYGLVTDLNPNSSGL